MHASFTGQDVPEHLYRLLVRQAEQERRSIAQQAIAVLSKGLHTEADPKARRREALRKAATFNRRVGQRLSDPVLLIREDRDR
jgi:hypothetical protein